MLPRFIIIGAMKCGISSLYHYLQLHPEVGMSEIKEVDYFVAENNFDNGVEWYESQFKGDFKTYGEASPNYTKAHFFEGVPRRMHELLPDIKLIYLVRDPVERIISHYTHNYSEGREHRDINEALQNLSGNHYVMCSKYYWQLEQYLTYYAADQILVMPSCELRNKRRSALEHIFTFLGVDSSFYTPAYEEQKHKTNKKRRKGPISRFVLESPVIKTLKHYLPDSLKDPVKKLTRREVKKPQLSPEMRNNLHEFLHSDIEKLRAFSKRSFTPWNI